MEKVVKINISKQFSRVPAGRFYTDGNQSGEAFREKFLRPALDEGALIEITLDGARGYGSSFLEEAFGGLIRLGYTLADLSVKLKFISEDDLTLIDEINEYMLEESERQVHRNCQ